jgi:hypothetical protein
MSRAFISTKTIARVPISSIASASVGIGIPGASRWLRTCCADMAAMRN